MMRTIATAAVSVLAVCSFSRGEDARPQGSQDKRTADCVYVPTPNDVVEKMIEMGKVTKDDLVYDLGCGDGRMVVLAAKKTGCKGVGYEVDPERIAEAKRNVQRKKVEQLVSIERQDIFKLDISKASVLLLYLLPNMEVKLIPQMEKMKAGSRVVCHDYPIDGVTEEKSLTMTSNEDGVKHTIYLYRLPLKRE